MIAFRLIILALANFAVGTAELVIAGILPLVARDVDVSVEAGGFLVTVYAVVFAVGGPLMSGLSRRYDRRNLLLAGLGLFVFGNTLAILTSLYPILLLSRVIAASGSALSSTQVLSAAANLVPVSQRGRALSIAFAGFSAAAVLGVPLGTFVGQNVGWRGTFGFVIALSLLAAVGIRLLLPSLPPQPVTTTEKWTMLPNRSALLAALLVSLLHMIGQYTLYTYMASFLGQQAGLNGNDISLVLFFYGAVGTVGSLTGGYVVDRVGVLGVMLVCLIMTALPLILLSLIGTSLLTVILCVATWGLFAWAFAPIQQYRLLDLATPRFGDLVASLNLSVFNIGIAAGSALGGLVISTGGLSNLGLVGGLVVAPSVLVPLWALFHSAPHGKLVPAPDDQ